MRRRKARLGIIYNFMADVAQADIPDRDVLGFVRL